MTPYYQDEAVTLYHAKCEDVLPHLSFSCVLTDPPYGVKMKRGDSKIQTVIAGDDAPPDISFLAQYPSIVWGGNNFCDQLPRSTGWLVWYKYNPDMAHHSQAELAWTNVVRTIRHYAQQYSGFMRAADGWHHPTQKPVKLMVWCMGFLPDGVIVDPYAGSGSTGVAAKQVGRKCILIDIDEQHCEKAAERLCATSQGVLPFPPPQPAQAALFDTDGGPS